MPQLDFSILILIINYSLFFFFCLFLIFIKYGKTTLIPLKIKLVAANWACILNFKSLYNILLFPSFFLVFQVYLEMSLFLVCYTILLYYKNLNYIIIK